MKEKGIIVTILVCLLAVVTVIDVGLYTANRMIVKSYEAKIQQIQTQIATRDGNVQQLIGQLKATKTIQEVYQILGEIK